MNQIIASASVQKLHKTLFAICLYGFLMLLYSGSAKADSGYRLWLKYDKIQDQQYLRHVKSLTGSIGIAGNSPILKTAANELHRGLQGLLGADLPLIKTDSPASGLVLAGTLSSIPALSNEFKNDLNRLGKEGYIIKSINAGEGKAVVILANTDIGTLYGAFHFLRLVQTGDEIAGIDIKNTPSLQWRMLNHWDNIDGSVERGYAGRSIWKWEELPAKIDQRYIDYARANASIGINGVVLNNVNASPQFLSTKYLQKTAALADVFRPYGIRVFLSANFASPKTLGRLKTADPLDSEVQQWWEDKTNEIYKLIPDFGGFLVKANSEGQPGPQDYGRSHSEGANMMAAALAPHKGILIWRAFVYKSANNDRVKDAYAEFKPLDGSFAPNVFVQIKNGPLDFQPREPFSPLFGAMPKTSQMLEFQITQEYLGFSTHLVYLAPLYKETLQADTYASGKGSTISRIIDGSLQGQRMTGIAGVANIGSDTNWTGHPFAQANWYAFGRLAWDPELSSKEIASEWIKMTLTKDEQAEAVILDMMVNSREVLVNYQSPLGLNTLSSVGHHHGPQPWKRMSFHRADKEGLGFDRTASGSNAVSQYFEPVRNIFENIETCPENLLAWFHHVPWNYRMRSGRTFWEELCFKYYSGAASVKEMQEDWQSVKGQTDPETFEAVGTLLQKQHEEAIWWRDACLLYFGKFSGMPLPAGFEKPVYTEEKLKEREEKIKGTKVYSIN